MSERMTPEQQELLTGEEISSIIDSIKELYGLREKILDTPVKPELPEFVIFEDCNGNQVAISHGMKVAVNFHDAEHSCIHSEGYYNLYAIVKGTVPEVLAKLRGSEK